MTTHYLDVRILPAAVAPGDNSVMSLAFERLHKMLARMDEHGIGVSFPHLDAATQDIGQTMRLHGEKAALEALQATRWLAPLDKAVIAYAIAAVPDKVRHCRVRRVQPKTSVERRRRRYARRHPVSLEQARDTIPDSVQQKTRLPYLTIASASTRMMFPIFFEHQVKPGPAKPGTFNFYGLSTEATVPWF